MFEPQIRQRYQNFQQALLKLHTILGTENPDGVLLKENFQACQHIFQHQIASLTENDLSPPEVLRWQPWQTEIHRLLRLLEMDVMFLQASRQTATAASRTISLRDRITTLVSLCDALLEKK
jgi:hypothetical protein